jgi:phage shock protein A
VENRLKLQREIAKLEREIAQLKAKKSPAWLGGWG